MGAKTASPKIGVFDSGIGGLSVANAIRKALPDDEVIFVNDQENIPYGTKTPEAILGLVEPILKKLEDEGCRVIVIACNTVTTTVIDQLRKLIRVPLVAVEPMVKPASEYTKSKVIAICATPATLASGRYKHLKNEYAKGIKIIEPDCRDWTEMVQNDRVDREKIFNEIDGACREGADVIVLACTHYHWIEDMINEISAGRALVIQPETAVIKQLNRVLEQLS